MYPRVELEKSTTDNVSVGLQIGWSQCKKLRVRRHCSLVLSSPATGEAAVGGNSMVQSDAAAADKITFARGSWDMYTKCVFIRICGYGGLAPDVQV